MIKPSDAFLCMSGDQPALAMTVLLPGAACPSFPLCDFSFYLGGGGVGGAGGSILYWERGEGGSWFQMQLGVKLSCGLIARNVLRTGLCLNALFCLLLFLCMRV